MKLDALSRGLLAGAALIFASGGILHAVAYFSKAHVLIEAANVKLFLGTSSKSCGWPIPPP
jgi:hypothetical protein